MEEKMDLEIGEQITVEDEEGFTLEAEVIDIFELTGNTYIVLADAEQMENGDHQVDVFFAKWDGDGYSAVSEDLEFKRVEKYLNNLMTEM